MSTFFGMHHLHSSARYLEDKVPRLRCSDIPPFAQDEDRSKELLWTGGRQSVRKTRSHNLVTFLNIMIVQKFAEACTYVHRNPFSGREQMQMLTAQGYALIFLCIIICNTLIICIST